MARPFKPGDRVRYVGRHETNTPSLLGKTGVVQSTQRGGYYIAWDDRSAAPSGVLAGNVEAIKPASPFEQDLMAYLDEERQELGI